MYTCVYVDMQTAYYYSNGISRMSREKGDLNTKSLVDKS